MAANLPHGSAPEKRSSRLPWAPEAARGRLEAMRETRTPGHGRHVRRRRARPSGARALEAPDPDRAPVPRLHHRRRHAAGCRLPAARRVPRGIGIALHYFGLVVLFGLLLWAVVPRVKVGDRDRARAGARLRTEASESDWVPPPHPARDRRAPRRAAGSRLSSLDPAVEYTVTAFEIMVGIVFTLACAAYWIFERKTRSSWFSRSCP